MSKPPASLPETKKPIIFNSKRKKNSKPQKQLNLHQFYQPSIDRKPSLSKEKRGFLSESTQKTNKIKQSKNSMNEDLPLKSDEITISHFPSFTPIDRDHIFPQKDQENRAEYKQISITKKKKRKFSELDSDTPKSPSLIKKNLRKESFENFSLYHSKDLLTTAIKTNNTEPDFPKTIILEPHSPIKFTKDSLECEELFQSDTKSKLNNMQSFEELDAFFDIPFDLKILNHLDDPSNLIYLPDKTYLSSKQPHMSWSMRAILLDWMMEVCNDYMLKRQTYHMAVNYVDRFLSLQANVPKNKLQLLGVVSLYVASKLEEIYPPKLKDFALVGHDYGLDEIKNYEELLLKTLKFKLNPCVMTFWADWYMFQWDMLIEEKMQIPEETFHSNMEILQFKQPNETSYKLYREFFQVLDCAMLDYKYLEFDGKLIVLAFICLLLWGYLMKITLKSIAERYNEIYREDSQGLYRLFSEFLKRTNKCKLYDIASVMEFCSKHFSLELEYDYPLATKLNRENVLEGHYGEFLAFQTHNSNNLSFLKNKKK